ncbi:hypothetical protein LCGC14_2607780, partial [marine sediment metagenome]
ANIKITGGQPGWTFHMHAEDGRLDVEKTFNRNGNITIDGLDPDFYSVLHTAQTWGDGGAGGVSLPLQIRAGDVIDIG